MSSETVADRQPSPQENRSDHASAPAPGPRNLCGARRLVWVLALLGLWLAVALGVVRVLFDRQADENPGPNVAQQAYQHMQRHKPGETLPLNQLLAMNPNYRPYPSDDVPILGKTVDDFALKDAFGQMHAFSKLHQSKPTLIIFYYGYWCDHCVSQLFALQEDIGLFNQLGANIIAISPDDPADTRERFQQYGKFSFTVLSDPQGKIAQRFGVADPHDPTDVSLLKHGTFVIDPQGVIRWANVGDQPFYDNQTLLYMLDKSKSARPKVTSLAK